MGHSIQAKSSGMGSRVKICTTTGSPGLRLAEAVQDEGNQMQEVI